MENSWRFKEPSYIFLNWIFPNLSSLDIIYIYIYIACRLIAPVSYIRSNLSTGSNCLEETQTAKPWLGMQDRKPEKKVIWTQIAEMWRRTENYGNYFKWTPRKGPTLVTKMWRQNPEQSNTRTATENKKHNIKDCIHLSRSATVYLSLSI